LISISKEIFKKVLDSQGVFYQYLSKIDRNKLTTDLLNPQKAILQADILQKYTKIHGKRILEVGSGLGVNHIVWSKLYNIDGYGIEPDGEGFGESYSISIELIKNNSLDVNKIIRATGENIPFPDNYFDIVYSTNVLEHVSNPGKVLDESMRVLKPNGTLQFIYPNFHSFYDGHYAVMHPPIPSNNFFQWYVRTIFRRDPTFAKTLRTELNVIWTRRLINDLKKKYNFETISMGEEIFYERMATSNFETWGGLTIIGTLLSIARRIKLNRIAAYIMLRTLSWAPIILTINKLDNE
jgi:ubiquinone/menaquinone biosynthesis C-methylase UbiE